MNSVVNLGSVEGSVSADEISAAMIIRQMAETAKDEIVAKAKADTRKNKEGQEYQTAYGLHRIALALRTCANRYQMSRSARREAAVEALRLEQTKAGSTATEQ
jgi:hypothetical protein